MCGVRRSLTYGWLFAHDVLDLLEVRRLDGPRRPIFRIHAHAHPTLETGPRPVARRSRVAVPDRVVMRVIEVPLEIVLIRDRVLPEPRLPHTAPPLAPASFVGTWESETFENGEKIGADADKRRWAPGKHCLIMTSSGEESGAKLDTTRLSGWDAQGKQLVEHWYTSQGLYAAIRYPLAGMKKERLERYVHLRLR